MPRATRNARRTATPASPAEITLAEQTAAPAPISPETDPETLPQVVFEEVAEPAPRSLDAIYGRSLLDDITAGVRVMDAMRNPVEPRSRPATFGGAWPFSTRMFEEGLHHVNVFGGYCEAFPVIDDVEGSNANIIGIRPYHIHESADSIRGRYNPGLINYPEVMEELKQALNSAEESDACAEIYWHFPTSTNASTRISRIPISPAFVFRFYPHKLSYGRYTFNWSANGKLTLHDDGTDRTINLTPHSVSRGVSGWQFPMVSVSYWRRPLVYNLNTFVHQTSCDCASCMSSYTAQVIQTLLCGLSVRQVLVDLERTFNAIADAQNTTSDGRVCPDCEEQFPAYEMYRGADRQDRCETCHNNYTARTTVIREYDDKPQLKFFAPASHKLLTEFLEVSQSRLDGLNRRGLAYWVDNFLRDRIKPDWDNSESVTAYNDKLAALHAQVLSTPFLGMELEVECGEDTNREPIAEAILDAVGREKIICKNDGSLDNGFEIVSMPATLEEAKKLWAGIAKVSEMRHLRSWNTNTCGGHIHISRHAFTPGAIGRLVAFVNNPANKRFMIGLAGRECSEWADFTPDHGLSEGYRTNNENKYIALSLRFRHTVEFRIFKGTTDAIRLQRNLESVHALAMYCSEISLPAQRYGAWNLPEAAFNYTAFIAWLAKPSRKGTYPLLSKWLPNWQASPIKWSGDDDDNGNTEDEPVMVDDDTF